MVGRRHDGSEHSQPARFASWSLVFSVKSSLFLFAIRCSQLRPFPRFHIRPRAASAVTVLIASSYTICSP